MTAPSSASYPLPTPSLPGVVAAVFLALAACSKPAAPPELVDIPQPALATMEPSVASLLEERFAAVEALRQDPDHEAPALAQAYGKLGQLYHAYQLYDAAQAAYGNAQTLAPKAFPWPYLRGNLRQAQGDLEGASDDYRRALELQSDDVPTLARLGRLLLDRGLPEEGEPLLEQALKLDEACAVAHFALAKAASSRGDLQTAVEHFSTALELQPQASIVHYPLSQAYRGLGNTAAADDHLARRGTARLDLADPYMGEVQALAGGTGSSLTRGGLASQQGLVKEAVEEYRQAVLADPNNATTRRDLAFALAQAGNVDEAMAQLEKTLKLDPDNPLTHNAFGALKAQQGRIEDAVPNFEAAIRADPNFEDALFNLAAAEVYLERHDAARKHLDRVLEINPQHPRAYALRARSLAADKEYEKAREDFRKALEIRPQDVDSRLNLAELAEGLGDSQEAIAEYRKVVAAAPASTGRAKVNFRLAELLRQQKDLDGAVDHYRQALADDPSLGEARFNLAGTLGLLGHYEEVLPEYQLLREAAPDNEVVRLGEATALAFLGRYGELTTRLEEGIEAIPQSAALGLLLSRLLSASPQGDLRDPQRALAIAHEAFEALPNLPSAETLAMALAATGQYSAAADQQKKILDTVGTQLDPKALTRLETHLRSYQAGEECCADLGPGGEAMDVLFGGLYGRS